MSTLILIRHGLTDMVGRAVCGRTPGVHLNDEGRIQAEALPGRLAGVPVSAIYSSPLERALETSAPLSRHLGIEVQVNEAFAEVDYGNWTGRSFDSLKSDPEWQRFRAFRSGSRFPGGEWIAEAQLRIVGELEKVRQRHPGQTVAVFSHGDIVRYAIAFFLGLPLDLAGRIEISPVSLNMVEVSDQGPRILRLNDTGVRP